MRKVIIGVVVAIAMGFALPAKALFVSSYDFVGALAGSHVREVFDISNLTPSSQVNMNTRPSVEAASLNVHRYGSKVYTANSTGIWENAIGVPGAAKIKSGTDYTLLHGRGNNMLIFNGGASRPFLYDVSDRQVSSIRPRLTSVTSAEFSGDSRLLVMLGKNINDQEKIFLSRGSVRNIQSSIVNFRQYNLPPTVTSCSKVAISPTGVMVAAVCTGSNGTSIFVATITNYTIGSWHRKTVVTETTSFSPLTIAWSSDRRLVVGGWDINLENSELFSPAWYQYIVSATGRFTTVARLNFTYTVSELFGDTGLAILTPTQIQSSDRAGFYYTLGYLGGDTVDTTQSYFGTLVGYYSFLTNTNVVLADTGDWHVLSTAQNYNP